MWRAEETGSERVGWPWLTNQLEMEQTDMSSAMVSYTAPETFFWLLHISCLFYAPPQLRRPFSAPFGGEAGPEGVQPVHGVLSADADSVKAAQVTPL